jgi:hypothetical protein
MVDLDRKITKTRLVKDFNFIGPALFPGYKWTFKYHVSPSGRGVHFIATAREGQRLPVFRILLAQCLMGSDIGREKANLVRIRAGIKDWNRLFSTKRLDLF